MRLLMSRMKGKGRIKCAEYCIKYYSNKHLKILIHLCTSARALAMTFVSR